MNVLISSGALYFTRELDYSEGYNAFCLCEALAKNGVELTVLAPSASASAKIDRARIIGLGTFETTTPLPVFASKWFAYNLKVLSRARGIIREVEPDLVHHIFPSWIDYGYSIYPIFDQQRPFIYGPVLTQASGNDKRRKTPKDRIIDFYRTGLSRRLYIETLKRASRVIVSVNDALRYLPSFVRSKSTTICHGIDTSLFSPATPNDVGSEFRVTYLGRLVPDKGAADAIKAIAYAMKSTPNILLQIIGSGPQREELESLVRKTGVSKHVRFFGYVPDSDVPSLLRNSHVFCCPSITDASPSVLLQAMACGVPVVATSVAGIPEMLGYGRCGLLVRPNNPKELSEAFAKLFNDPELARELGKNGRTEVERKYDWNVIAQKVVRVYNESLS